MKEITEGFKGGAVVGAIMDPETLAIAGRLPLGLVDFVEVRVDSLAKRAGTSFVEQALKEELERVAFRKLVTVRHISQGGMYDFSPKERAALYARFLPIASAIDIEVRLVSRFLKTVEEAHQAGVKVILSEHDFQATPSLRYLRSSAKKAREAGADGFKIAAQVNTPGDVGVLATFLSESESLGIPLAVMGMGPFGKVSRLLLASGGSILNYCSLSPEVAVPGQWSAEVFKARVEELSR